MPKLIILAACEKVIIDRAQIPSLIGIFQGVNIQVTEDMPERAVTQMRWNIFTAWQHDLEELGVEFTQHMEVVTPRGEQFIKGETKFKVTDANDLQSRIGTEINSIPVSDQGHFTVRVWLDNSADSKSEYKFYLKHLPLETKTPATETVSS